CGSSACGVVFSYTPSRGWVDLGNPYCGCDEDAEAYASAVNDHGEIAATAESGFSADLFRAFTYTPSGGWVNVGLFNPEDRLDSSSFANAINNHAEIVDDTPSYVPTRPRTTDHPFPF